MLLGPCPHSPYNQCSSGITFLNGSNTNLFFIEIRFNEETKKTIGIVTLSKLDVTSINWEEIEGLKDWDMTDFGPEMWLKMMKKEFKDLCKDLDNSCQMWEQMLSLKDAIFCVDLACDCSVFYGPEITSELGGYIHIRDKNGKIILSYNIKNNTISLSSMPMSQCGNAGIAFNCFLFIYHICFIARKLFSENYIWCRLEDVHGKEKGRVDYIQKVDKDDNVELDSKSNESPEILLRSLE